MRRVRLEKRYCQETCARATESGAETPSVAAVLCARASPKGYLSGSLRPCRFNLTLNRPAKGPHCSTRRHAIRPAGEKPRRRKRQILRFPETITDAVERFDHLEAVVNRLELLAQTLDVAVDGAIIHIDLFIIGRIHQGVTAFDHAGALGK
ncbi:Uncharacterised protein [Brucella melitensis]|nr:Uncharacterised protein [Brucella melitensis]